MWKITSTETVRDAPDLLRILRENMFYFILSAMQCSCFNILQFCSCYKTSRFYMHKKLV